MYEPAEDSWLLASVLEKYIEKHKITSFLDVGCGSGVLLDVAKKENISNVCGLDINPRAVAHCKKQGFTCVHSDLFESIKGKFDIITFNPPYLPLDEKEPKDSRMETTGGKEGAELLNRFLHEAKNFLTRRGIIFVLISSLTRGVVWKGYRKKLVAKQKLFFEELRVYQLRSLVK